MIYIILVLLLLAFFIMWKKDLVVTEYTVAAPIDMDILILSDLHSMNFGEGQRELLDLVDSLDFDIITLPGDIFDDSVDDARGYEFAEGIKNYECYYILGNNEVLSGKAELHMKNMRSLGIHTLDDEKRVITKDTNRIAIYGFTDRDALSMKDLAGIVETSLDKESETYDYSIVLAHKPFARKYFGKFKADLVICGHAHGGQWRLPPINNGVFAPNQGIFPKYAGGVYEANGRYEVVSRGLARGLKLVPRLNNPPEIVLLHLRK